MKQYMVRVEWHDARFFQGLYSKDACKEHKLCLFNSLGYLIKRDSTTITIAAERDDEGGYRDITLIPIGSVISIRKLLMGHECR